MLQDQFFEEETVRHISSRTDITEHFRDLEDMQWEVLFMFHYPDLVIPVELAQDLRILPPRQVERPLWVYLDERRLVSFTGDRYQINDVDDRMQVLFQYGFPDNIDRFERRDGLIEKWDYYSAGISITFLDGARYRSTQY